MKVICARCKKTIEVKFASAMGELVFGTPKWFCWSCENVWDKLYKKYWYDYFGNCGTIEENNEAWLKLYREKFMKEKEVVIFT